MMKLKRFVCALTALILLSGQAPYGKTALASSFEETSSGKTDSKAFSYSAYIAQYGSEPRPRQTYRIPGGSYIEASADVKREDGYAWTTASDTVTYQVAVSQAGIYNIAFEYVAAKGNGAPIERALYLDGELPFVEAENLTFTRIWRDLLTDNDFSADTNGDQLRPTSEEVLEEQIFYASDSSGYVQNAFDFYFSAGEHTITLKSIRETLKLKSILLTQKPDVPSYQETSATRPQNPDLNLIRIEAEKMLRKSHASVHAGNDSSSPLTEPQSSRNLLMNVLDGNSWMTPGQWVEWEFFVETAGQYQIDCRFLQNINIGLFSSREIMIDGKLPFREAAQIKFPYGREWQVKSLGDENGAFSFYLEEGCHTLRMRAVLGEMGDTLQKAEECVNQLNSIYREILFVTGVTADPYRTYNFTKIIPETIEKIKKAEKTVAALAEDIRSITGRSNSYTALLDRLAFQLNRMGEEPEEHIASNFSSFKTNIGSFSSLLSTMRKQPLTLDCIVLRPYGAELPKAESSVFSRLYFSFIQFLWSFFRDYSVMDAGQDIQNRVVVWSSAGRDQTQILQQMILEDFSPSRNTSVTMQLVPANTLLPAVLAGSGPDVSLFNESGRPVDFAVRGAVVDLTAMKDYSKVASRFLPASLVPFSVGEKVYALPETQSIPMLFYREDILSSLDLSVPETWDDFYEMLFVLQRNNMNAGITMDLNGLCIFLFQIGSRLYNEEGTKILLNTDEGLTAFKRFSELYTKYKLQPTFSFVDRFRSGEMPIAIQDYSAYTQLCLSAPEIKGLWKMAPIPGTVLEDGSVCRAAPTTGTASILLNNASGKEAAWEFLKWWTQGDVQQRFSEELGILLGEETFFSTANTRAFMAQNWTVSQQEALLEQRKQLVAIPNVPGGYYTSRYVAFALANVYNLGEKPTEAILAYVDEINDELMRKRTELELLS